jgi:carboxyl-terminal processing protease
VARFFRLLAASLALLLATNAIHAADDPIPFPDMAKVVGDLLDKSYYDHKRFHPRIMVERALRALEQSEMSIETRWQGGSIVLTCGDAPKKVIDAPEPTDLEQAMALIEQVRIEVEKAADLPPARRRELSYAMINGALLSLDPHTVLLPPEPAKEFGEEIHGEFYGIGAYLVQEEGIIAIERVMPGLPADRAGVEDGDVILRVDGERTAGLSLEQAVKRIKGPKGSAVTLTLERKGTDKPIELPITRDLVQVISIRAYRSGDVGYVRMDDFSSNTHRDLYNAINQLQQQGPLSAFVIDLRFNGGGLLDAAKTIARFFLPKGREVVRTVTVDGPPDIDKTAGKPFFDFPMVALVSGGSASAAEILSGTLQRNDRALVAGTTTFGKGSVQSIKDLRDGSKLKLTIQEYQLAGGVSIQDVGVTPDLRLVRHSMRKDGNVDLLPFTREREVDDEFALGANHKYEHDSAYELGWLAQWQSKDEMKRSSLSARDFQPDPEASLVIDLLKEAVARPGFADGAEQARKEGHMRQFLVDQLKEPVAKRAETESASLAKALEKREPAVTWGPSARPAPGTLTVTYTGPAELHAGETAPMRFAVKNAGGAELGRLYGVINADKYSPLWEEELLIGDVAAGATHEATMTFRVPPRLYDSEERFTLDVFGDGSSTPLTSTPVTVKVIGQPRVSERLEAQAAPSDLPARPHFSYSWKVEEPSGDGMLAPGETGTVVLTLRNDGKAPSTKVKLSVYKSDDPYVQLGEVRFILDQGLTPGAESTQRVPITVLKEVKRNGQPAPFSADSVKLQIRAEEAFDDDESPGVGVYRATLYSVLTLPINQPLTGGTVVQPQLTLLGMQSLGADRVKLRVRIQDDNPRFVSLFQDEDKVDLVSALSLGEVGAAEDEAGVKVKSLVYEPTVTLKSGLNNVRVVVSDRDEVADVLPLRLWGTAPAADKKDALKVSHVDEAPAPTAERKPASGGNDKATPPADGAMP